MRYAITGISVYFGGNVSNGNYVNIYVDGQRVASGIQGATYKEWNFRDTLGATITYQTVAKPHNEYLQVADWSEIAEIQIFFDETKPIIGDGRGNVFSGGGASEVVMGNGGNDRLIGGGGGDTLNGGYGADTLYGGIGADAISGGAGKDFLSGGMGGDRFVFRAIDDSGSGTASVDVILDFHAGSDKVDLRAIDALAATKGLNDSFVWNGRGVFSDVSRGEVRFVKHDNSGTSNDYTVIVVDNDADANFEMLIRLDGLHNLTASDVLL